MSDLIFTDYPVAIPPGSIGGGFKAIYTRADGTQYEHPGLDFPAPLDAEIRWWSPNEDGSIVWHKPGDGWGDGSLGVCAVVDVANTPYWVVFAHMTLESWEPGTKPLRNGALLGWIGMTGRTTGPHTHVAISSEPTPNFNPMRVADASGIERITNPDLHDPATFYRISTLPEYADLVATVNNLNTAVLDLQEQFRIHTHGRPQ